MKNQRPFLIIFIFSLVLILYYIDHQPKATAPQFLIHPQSPLTKNIPPYFKSQFIPQPSFLLMSHSATFNVLANGDLLALWFSGSKEGRADVNIWSSRYKHNQWSMAQSVVSPKLLSKGLNQYIKKVGNPSVYRDAHGIFHLFVVSVGPLGGWAISNLNHLYSYDNGKTWSNPKRLVLTPFFNISTLARITAIPLADGGFYLPVYYEFGHTYPELLWFDKKGDLIRQIRMTHDFALIQPTIIARTPSKAQAFLRNHSTPGNILYTQSTNDAGLHWTKPTPTNLYNYDMSIAVIKLSTGPLLMVRNPQNDKHDLVLSTSTDGITWSHAISLEKTIKGSLSYPTIEEHDGIIDILYSWDFKKIKHVRFNLAWLEKKLQES